MSEGDCESGRVTGWECIDHWNVKVYDSDEGFERETIRGLTVARKETLMAIFEREGVQAQALPYTNEGRFVHGHSDSVNWGAFRDCEWCDDGGLLVEPRSVEGSPSQMKLCQGCEDRLDEAGLLL